MEEEEVVSSSDESTAVKPPLPMSQRRKAAAAAAAAADTRPTIITTAAAAAAAAAGTTAAAAAAAAADEQRRAVAQQLAAAFSAQERRANAQQQVFLSKLETKEPVVRPSQRDLRRVPVCETSYVFRRHVCFHVVARRRNLKERACPLVVMTKARSRVAVTTARSMHLCRQTKGPCDLRITLSSTEPTPPNTENGKPENRSNCCSRN